MNNMGLALGTDAARKRDVARIRKEMDALCIQGVSLSSNNKPEEAFRLYLQALALDPTRWLPYQVRKCAGHLVAPPSAASFSRTQATLVCQRNAGVRLTSSTKRCVAWTLDILSAIPRTSAVAWLPPWRRYAERKLRARGCGGCPK